MVKWEKILIEIRISAWSNFSIRKSEEAKTISSRKKQWREDVIEVYKISSCSARSSICETQSSQYEEICKERKCPGLISQNGYWQKFFLMHSKIIGGPVSENQFDFFFIQTVTQTILNCKCAWVIIIEKTEISIILNLEI